MLFFTKCLFLFGLATTFGHCAKIFKPENSSTVIDSRYPLSYNFSASQTIEDVPSNSYWSTSFVTASDNHQYLIVSHTLLGPATYFGRSSILNLTDQAYWSNLTYFEKPSIVYDGRLNVTTIFFGFLGLSADSIAQQNTWMTTPEYSYNITFQATTEAILNMGGNAFAFGNGNTTEWGLPSAKTSGSFSLNGKSLQIDPGNSFTWYDRQFSYGVPLNGNWTWFELHFGDIKASVWAIDSPIPERSVWRFATVRTQSGHAILPYNLTSFFNETWTSPASNLTYPLRWKLDFENGDHLDIRTTRPDQEIAGANATRDFAYEGYIEVKGSFLGAESGFGVAEMVTLTV